MGIGMGKTCEPKAFSFQCMTKFTTNKKKEKEKKLTAKFLFLNKVDNELTICSQCCPCLSFTLGTLRIKLTIREPGGTNLLR